MPPIACTCPFAALTAAICRTLPALSALTRRALCARGGHGTRRALVILLHADNVLPRGDECLAVVEEDGRRPSLLMHRDDTSLALVGDDTVVLRGDILLFLFHAHTAAAAVALALVFQAAHKPSADPRDLRRVE